MKNKLINLLFAILLMVLVALVFAGVLIPESGLAEAVFVLAAVALIVNFLKRV